MIGIKLVSKSYFFSTGSYQFLFLTGFFPTKRTKALILNSEIKISDNRKATLDLIIMELRMDDLAY